MSPIQFYCISIPLLLLAACTTPQPVKCPASSARLDSIAGNDSAVSNFQGRTWDTGASFLGAEFGDSAYFRGSRFACVAQFTGATFSNAVNFEGAIFDDAAYFDDVTFPKIAYFVGVQFSNYAKFTNLQNTDSVQMYFDNARLPDTLDFSENGSLKCNIDLTTANFGTADKQPCLIYLYRTDISRFQLDYFHFRLLLPDYTLSPNYNNRRERISTDEKDAVYEALLNNFKLSGQDESYERLDKEYQKFKWGHSWASWLVWVPWIWWNFGYDKEFIFFWIVGLLLLFTSINYSRLEELNTSAYEIESPDKLKNIGPGKRFWHSIVYTVNVFFRVTLDTKCMRFTHIGLTIYFLIIYVMGILCLGYLANFIVQK